MNFVRVLLLCGGLQPVPTSPGTLVMDCFPSLDSEGGVLFAGHDELYHWRIDGSLRTLKAAHPVRHFYYSGTFYWVGGQNHSTFFDRSGSSMGSLDRDFPWLLQNTKNTQPMASLRFSWKALENNMNFPPLVSLVNIIFENPIRYEVGLEFAKATPKMQKMQYQFTRIWPVVHKDTYYVLDQLEANVRVYNREDIQREQRQGWTSPDDAVRVVPLYLRKYHGMPNSFRKIPPGLYDVNHAQTILQQWWDSIPLIVFFGETETGHVVAHRIPERVGSLVIGFRIGVQLLGKAPNFSPLGPMLEIPEIQTHADMTTAYHVAGWDNEHVVLFWPNIKKGGGMSPRTKRYTYKNHEWTSE